MSTSQKYPHILYYMKPSQVQTFFFFSKQWIFGCCHHGSRHTDQGASMSMRDVSCIEPMKEFS